MSLFSCNAIFVVAPPHLFQFFFFFPPLLPRSSFLSLYHLCLYFLICIFFRLSTSSSSSSPSASILCAKSFKWQRKSKNTVDVDFFLLGPLRNNFHYKNQFFTINKCSKIEAVSTAKNELYLRWETYEYDWSFFSYTSGLLHSIRNILGNRAFDTYINF